MLSCYFGAGSNEEAIAFGEESIAIAREHGLKEELAYALNDINRPYFEAGDAAKSAESLTEAAVLWRELNNLPMLADNLDATADMSLFMGRLDDAMENAEQSIAVSHPLGNAWAEAVAFLTVAFVDLERGDIGACLAHADTAEELGKLAGFTGILGFTTAIKASIMAGLGANDQAVEHAKEAVSWGLGTPWANAFALTGKIQVDHYSGAREIADDQLTADITDLERDGTNRYLQVTFNVAGEVLFERGLYDQVFELTERTLGVKAAQGIVVGVPELSLLKGQALVMLGRKDEARTTFLEGVGVAELYGLRRSLWPLLAELAQLEEESGDSQSASRYRAQAREIVEHISKNTGSEELTASFLALPRVQAVLRV